MTDIYEDIRIVVQRHREQAAAEERDKIVAWLREDDGYMLAGDISYRRDLAAEIEEKEHLK
jgi:hypothetical protein